jgi:hypothetical protein
VTQREEALEAEQHAPLVPNSELRRYVFGSPAAPDSADVDADDDFVPGTDFP